MNEMVSIVPSGSCPNCGHKQFIVYEEKIDEYLTNGDGEVIDSIGIEYNAIGKCCRCHHEFTMMPTPSGFIPITKLREILFDYTPHATIIHVDNYEDIPNPMEAK